MKVKGTNKFAVGDKVRVIKDSHYFNNYNSLNNIYNIVGVTNSLYNPYRISRSDGDGYLVASDDELEYFRVRDTKIARKVYKNNIDKTEDGWIYLKS